MSRGVTYRALDWPLVDRAQRDAGSAFLWFGLSLVMVHAGAFGHVPRFHGHAESAADAALSGLDAALGGPGEVAS